MAANQTILTGQFGVSDAAPTALTLRVTFTEAAVNAATGNSWVTATVQLVNPSDRERWYRYLDGVIRIRVGNVVQKLTGANTYFDLKSGQTVTKAKLNWYSVNHSSGSVSIGMSADWPTGTGSAGDVPSTNGTLTLDNAPAPPTPVQWPSNGNAVGPTGVGTQTYLNWVNMANKSRTGVTQISPYTSMYVHVSQANYPSHFNPVLLASDMTIKAGGTLALSNYAVCTFWYTTLGTTLPSLTGFKNNVAANNLLVVRPPRNPPKTAIGWGLAVRRDAGVAADPTKMIVQSLNGTTQFALTKSWVSPLTGPKIGGSPPPSSSFANNFAWSSNVAVNVANTATGANIATIGGFWYQFYVVTVNKAGATSSTPQIYYANGTAPDTGGNTNGDTGSGANANTIFAPAANIAVIARALNSVTASASVVPTVAQIIDFATPSGALTESATPNELTNYCSDPRAYWLTANTGGNNTASPYVAEVNTAGYTSKNAQILPTQMGYALAALGLDEVDRGHTQTFINATNNTGSQVQHYVYIGGNPDAGNTAASFPVPVGATSVQVSAMAWINSANTTAGRTVTPYNAIKFSAIYANGVVAGTNTQTLSAIPVNALRQLSASYTLPASTARVSAAFVANTASSAGWNGGYGAGESITTTGFMMLFNQRPNTPYFDGGFPAVSANVFAIHTSADLGYASLAAIPNTRDGSAAGVP